MIWVRQSPNRVTARCGAAVVLFAAACGEPSATDPSTPEQPVDTEVTPDPPASNATPLDPLRLLIRASLDLRGVRPSLDELRAVQADPAALDPMIESFFADDRFAARVRETFDEVFLIRDEDSFVPVGEFMIPWPTTRIWEALGEEPTRMLERIARDDLSYAELVTGDWTMTNEVLGVLLPTDYPIGENGWRVAHYVDGRPHAGVLVSSGMWWQIGSMLNNLNRGRANQVSRVLLCFDYLNNEIDFTGVNVLDSEDALGEAIRTDPACTACHTSLDPLASSLYGFWFPSNEKSDFFGVRRYHPEQERLWAELGGPPPGFRGEEVSGLAELGRRIAEDPGYSSCFVRRSFEALLRRPPQAEEGEVVDAALERFRAGGLKVRDAWRAIVASDAYRNAEGDHSPKVVSPAMLSSFIEDLTGFRWAEGDWDLMRAPLRGYAPLAGGVDGITRNIGIIEPTPTLAAVVAQFAAMAARTAAEHDLADPLQARLLTRVDGSEARDGGTGERRARDQILDLHLRVLGEVVADGDEMVEAEFDLWADMLEGGAPPTAAWTAVITVLLRQPDVVVY
jgi:hypothetical protein